MAVLSQQLYWTSIIMFIVTLAGCGEDTNTAANDETTEQTDTEDATDDTEQDADAEKIEAIGKDAGSNNATADVKADPDTEPNTTQDTIESDPDDGESPEEQFEDIVLTEDGGLAGTNVYPPEEYPTTLGGDRPAKVLVPLDYSNTQSYPLVLNLHGYTGNSEQIDDYFNLSAYVSSKQFILITPEGTLDDEGQPFWNSPDCCDKFETDVDDLAYLLDLIEEAKTLIAIDVNRIYAVGLSNGGFMAHYLACQAPEDITAIAALAGVSPKNSEDCTPESGTSVLQIHGTLDPLVPYGGTIKFSSVDKTIADWAEINGCDVEMTSNEIPSNYDYFIPGPETQKITWDACDSDHQITHWKMVESGHTPYLHPDFSRDLLDWLFTQKHNGD